MDIAHLKHLTRHWIPHLALHLFTPSPFDPLAVTESPLRRTIFSCWYETHISSNFIHLTSYGYDTLPSYSLYYRSETSIRMRRFCNTNRIYRVVGRQKTMSYYNHCNAYK